MAAHPASYLIFRALVQHENMGTLSGTQFHVTDKCVLITTIVAFRIPNDSTEAPNPEPKVSFNDLSVQNLDFGGKLSIRDQRIVIPQNGNHLFRDL